MSKPPYLIFHDGYQGTKIPPDRTKSILKNLEYIESLPFDGIAINIAPSWSLMSGKSLSFHDIYDDWLKPLKGKFENLTHNYVMVHIDRPADPFDDWDTTIQNWRNMAKAAKKSGLKGIFFDNEEYLRPILNYPNNVDYADQHNLGDYQDQMRRRGRQIMEAMVEVFPDIEVMFFHGPYESEPKTPRRISEKQVGNSVDHELSGPLFTGFVEGMSPQSKVIDGGELYAYRREDKFQDSYDWRKYGIASNKTDSRFIPKTLRSEWADRVDISFGTYDLPFPGDDRRMNPNILRRVLPRALETADELVWFFSEDQNWLTPGGVNQEWLNAIADVQTAIRNRARDQDTRPDRLLGSDREDVLNGYAERERLHGRGQNDPLKGDRRADRILGNAGDDRLTGGKRRDQLKSSSSQDCFVLKTNHVVDRTLDFEQRDRLQGRGELPFDQLDFRRRSDAVVITVAEMGDRLAVLNHTRLEQISAAHSTSVHSIL